MSRVNPKSPI
ncbi:hypothetical protein C369_03929 [Cryptococcus neoformans A5-35-17]|nr:hypothetical protein C369_03929 [Cryptococcus neoformans var. grubii A5-35-17]